MLLYCSGDFFLLLWVWFILFLLLVCLVETFALCLALVFPSVELSAMLLGDLAPMMCQSIYSCGHESPRSTTGEHSNLF